MTRTRLSRHLLIAPLMLLPALCLAQADTEALDLEGTSEMEQGPRYTYLEGAWISQYLDELGIDGEGYAIHAAFALDRHWHLFTNYSSTKLGPSDTDTEFATAGIGYAFVIAPTWDLIARAGATRVKLNRVDVDGWQFQALARGQLGRFELESGMQYTDFTDDGGDDKAFLAAARYNITDWFSVGLGGIAGDDFTEYGLTIRFATH